MKYRKVQILQSNWITIKFEDLIVGNIMRMFEPDGTVVRNSKNHSIFIIMRTSYKLNKESELAVDVISVEIDQLSSIMV